MKTETLKTLYKELTGNEPIKIKALTGNGSSRQYFRLEGEHTNKLQHKGATDPQKHSVIGVCGTSLPENEAFIYMGKHFLSKGLPVPRILCLSADRTCYLQEDLGDFSLFKAIEKGRQTGHFSEEEIHYLSDTIRILPRIQFEEAEDMDFNYCHPLSDFNRRSIQWDLNYFKYCFLKATEMDFHENELEDDFEKLTDVLLGCEATTFMYRDFQSRNIMIHEETPYFIDFQGGRKGPIYYDVASFLWQAKANLPNELRMRLIDVYLEALQPYRSISREQFLHDLRQFVLFRTLQVLGTYGFRGFFEKKKHFLESVPFAMTNLRNLLKTDFEEYPYLCSVLKRLTELPQFAPKENENDCMPKDKDNGSKQEKTFITADGVCVTYPIESVQKLTVRVMSFSYKKGYPEDPSGNGGGYAFDCRGVHNPGRYDQYKQLTGLDQPVIDFLERDGEITTFLEHVYALADAHVARYLKRGFTNLMFSFGCTGGRHRSVYSAQHTAEYIHQKFGVKVEIIHREQGIENILEQNIR